jgi:hypothetical protein
MYSHPTRQTERDAKARATINLGGTTALAMRQTAVQW